MTRIKQFLALSLALLLLLPALANLTPAQAASEQKDYNGFTYNVVTDDGSHQYVVLRKYEGTETDLTIPEEIEGIPVETIYFDVLVTNTSTKSVTISKTVKNVWSYAFHNWTALESIYVDSENEKFESRDGVLYGKGSDGICFYPEGKKDSSLTMYGRYGTGPFDFWNPYLEEVIIGYTGGDPLPTAPEDFNLPNLKRFVTQEGDSARYTIDGILYKDDEKFGKWLIRYPAGKYTGGVLQVPEGTNSFYAFAFSNMANLTAIAIPASVSYIPFTAFNWSENLRDIYFGGSEEAWNELEFAKYGGEILNQITVHFNSYDVGLTISTGSFTDTIYWRLDEDGTLLIEGSGTLPRCSFENPEAVKRIVIGEGIEKLEINSLAEFTEVRSIEISSTVTEIKGSFRENVNQKEFLVSENNPCYSNDAYGVLFNKDKSILVTAPAGISGTYQIPDTVREIGSSSFYGCTGLSEVKIPSGVQTISETAFADCTGLERADLPDTLTSLGNGAFWNCTSLRSVSIPEGITVIPSAAFSHCTALAELTLPKTLTVISGEAFYGCGNLSGLLVIPDSVTEIQISAFLNTGYSEVLLPDGLKELGMCAFQGCRQLTSIVIPAGLERMGGHVFYGCSALKEVKIEAELTVIPWYVFYGCTSLKTIFLPASLQQIHGKAFENCTALTDVYFAGTEDAWNSLYIGEEGNECLKNAVVHCKAAPIGDGWYQEDGKWFYYENGSHITGWKRLPDSHWYYFDETGVLQHGWLLDNGNWYYLNASGFVVTGWQKLPDGHWYYFNGSGILQHGWLRDGGNWYYLNASGFMVTGWQKLPDGNWYYFNGSGVLQHNWVRYSGNWYYLNASGFMVTGWQRLPDGNWYYFDGSGVMQTGWLNRGGNWYYLNSSGIMQTGWQYIGGSWYYFYPGGNMASSTTLTLGGTRYTFDASGRWVA